MYAVNEVLILLKKVQKQGEADKARELLADNFWHLCIILLYARQRPQR
jgi:hypothetical protein